MREKKPKKPKQYTCKYRPCSKKFVREREGQEVCSVECGLAKAKIEVQKATKKEEARLKREFYEQDKTLTKWLDDLQNVVNTIVRLIDFKQPCIATGATTGKKNAGHFYAKNAIPSIRFNLHNLHLQSEHSNKWKRGDAQRYKEGLIHVYGKKYWELVENLPMAPAPEYTIEFAKQKIAVAKEIVKQFKRFGERVYSTDERIALRFKYNLELGINVIDSATAGLAFTWGNTSDDLPF